MMVFLADSSQGGEGWAGSIEFGQVYDGETPFCYAQYTGRA